MRLLPRNYEVGLSSFNLFFRQISRLFFAFFIYFGLFLDKLVDSGIGTTFFSYGLFDVSGNIARGATA